jgi:predicted CopG family antitoxin
MHIDIHMASKNVALHMSLVRRLDGLKRPGESYTHVIERLLPKEADFREVVAFLRQNPETGPDDLTPLVREARDLLNRPRRKGR